MKKAQGISINVIIIAAIALLVLVILAILVLRGGSNVKEGTESCMVKGGICKDMYDCDNSNDWLDGVCDVDGQVCCRVIRVGG